jgi:RNA polymerase sigma-70 factor (ECF subfamily)
MALQVDARSVPTDDLIARYQRGQTDAFAALFGRYKNYVYRIALLVTRSSSDAEEVVQETFLDVLRALPRYRIDGPARFETWLYRVTVNRGRMHLRQRRPPSADWDALGEQLANPNSNADPEAMALRGERKVLLWKAVDALPDHHRLVVILRYLHNLPYKEIAEVLDIREGTVKSRLYTAHQRLRERLAADERMAEEARVRAR